MFIPNEIWRHVFSFLLKENHLFIFNFTREMIILGNYDKDEIDKLFNDAIIKNFKITNVPFFHYCIKERKSILKCKIFLDNINNLNFINDSYLFESTSIYNILNHSIKSNNFILLKWLRINYKSIDNTKLCYFAIENNNLEMLRFFRERDEPLPWDETCCMIAVKNNNYKILRYLRSGNNLCPWDEQCCWYATKNNNFQILKFLRRKNNPCPLNKNCALEATKNNNLQILKYLKSQINLYPIDKKCTYYAVKNNNLEMLKFLREGNYPCHWDDWCCYISFYNDNLEILRFLREGNDPCPWSTFCYLKENRSVEILKFVEEENLF
jgi:hypothetical protein